MKRRILRLIRNVPLLGPILEYAVRKVNRLRFDNSSSYWEERYKKGRSSGEGSYGRLAAYKADVINSFIKKERVSSVIEFGCGDGNQLSLFQCPSYIGLDISANAISLCRRRFEGDITKSFFLYSPDCFIDNGHIFIAQLTLSLDVIYHIVEDELFAKYMHDLFNASSKHVIIYSSNDETIKEVSAHVRHRKFTNWVEKHCADWNLVAKLTNPFPYNERDPKEATSFADFYVYNRTSNA